MRFEASCALWSPAGGIVGSGIYFGLITVFLKSKPTIEVPRGTMTPPERGFNLYRFDCNANSLSSNNSVIKTVKSPVLPKLAEGITNRSLA